jgi:hypothetical protein
MSFELTDLHPLVLRHIWSYVDIVTFVQSLRVSHRLRRLLDHRFLWRVLYENAFGHAITLCCMERRLPKRTDTLATISQQIMKRLVRTSALRTNDPISVELRRRVSWLLVEQVSAMLCCARAEPHSLTLTCQCRRARSAALVTRFLLRSLATVVASSSDDRA